MAPPVPAVDHSLPENRGLLSAARTLAREVPVVFFSLAQDGAFTVSEAGRA
jgi:hypothetical protein